MAPSSLDARLGSGRPILLDGGMGRELMRRGLRLPDSIWSGQALLDAPDVVLAVHRDYCAAGAEVLTANTYGLTESSLERAGRPASDHRWLVALAVSLARQAAEGAGRAVAVAGSMPPAGRTYRPDSLPDSGAIARQFATQAETLARAGVDLLLAETLSTVEEAITAVRAGRQVGLPTWVAFSVGAGGALRSGMTFEQALASLGPMPSAVLVNCSQPRATSLALTSGVFTKGVPIGAYPNALAAIPEDYSYAQHGPMSSDPTWSTEGFVACCSDWVRRGCRIVGGCCGVGVTDISALRDRLES